MYGNFEGPISRKWTNALFGMVSYNDPCDTTIYKWIAVSNTFFPNVHPYIFGVGNNFPSNLTVRTCFKGGWWVQPRNETRDGHPLDVGNFEGATRCFTPRSLPVWLLEGEALVTTRVFSQAKQGVNLGYYIGVYVYIYIWLWKLCLKVKGPWDTLVKSWCIYNKPRVSYPWVERKHVFQSIMFSIHLNFPGCNLFMKL